MKKISIIGSGGAGNTVLESVVPLSCQFRVAVVTV